VVTVDSETRKTAWRSASKLSAPPSLKILIGLLSELIQLSRSNVSFDLPVPLIGSELFKPSGEFCELLWRQLGYSSFQFLDAHGSKGTIGGLGLQQSLPILIFLP
jgi:hypothetical protein